MPVTRWDNRFFETTRGRIVTHLRRGSQTVDELARSLGVSGNAVRIHLAALERDALIRQGRARPAGRTGGKPAYTYEIAPEAERTFTKAYIPVLTQLVSALAERLSLGEMEKLLRDVGRRLAGTVGPATGDLRARTEAAATVLTELGGVVDVEDEAGSVVLRGYSCPLADAVRAHPSACRATETLVEELIGAPVRERCDKGDRPRCRFEVVARDS